MHAVVHVGKQVVAKVEPGISRATDCDGSFPRRDVAANFIVLICPLLSYEKSSFTGVCDIDMSASICQCPHSCPLIVNT